MCHHQQLTSSVTSTHFSPKHVFSLLVCSYGTQSGQTVISRWCTAPACGSSTGAIPSSHSSMLTTPCCSCLASTSAHTTHHPGKSPSSAWVRTKTKAPKTTHKTFVCHNFLRLWLEDNFSFHNDLFLSSLV